MPNGKKFRSKLKNSKDLYKKKTFLTADKALFVEQLILKWLRDERGLAGVLFIIIWLLISMAVNVVLYVLYRITAKKNRRKCPACGINVAIGLTVCPKCSFDFAKAAGA